MTPRHSGLALRFVIATAASFIATILALVAHPDTLLAHHAHWGEYRGSTVDSIIGIGGRFSPPVLRTTRPQVNTEYKVRLDHEDMYMSIGFAVRTRHDQDQAQAFVFGTYDGGPWSGKWLSGNPIAGNQHPDIYYTVNKGVSSRAYDASLYMVKMGPTNARSVFVTFTDAAPFQAVVITPPSDPPSSPSGQPALGARIMDASGNGAFNSHFYDWWYYDHNSNKNSFSTSTAKHPSTSDDVHFFNLTSPAGKAVCAIYSGGNCPQP